jgi:hypothetical protein
MGEAMTQGQWAPLPAPPQIPYQPLQYPMPPPSKPSGIYKALGVIQMVLGGCGIIYSLFSIGTTAFSARAFYDDTTLAALLGVAATSTLTTTTLLATGIGIFRARRWARITGVVYSVVSLLNAFAGAAINLLLVQPKLMGSVGSVAPIARTFETMMIVSAVLGVVVSCIMPTVTLVFVLRGAAKTELDQ